MSRRSKLKATILTVGETLESYEYKSLLGKNNFVPPQKLTNFVNGAPYSENGKMILKDCKWVTHLNYIAITKETHVTKDRLKSVIESRIEGEEFQRKASQPEEIVRRAKANSVITYIKVNEDANKSRTRSPKTRPTINTIRNILEQFEEVFKLYENFKENAYFKETLKLFDQTKKEFKKDEKNGQLEDIQFDYDDENYELSWKYKSILCTRNAVSIGMVVNAPKNKSKFFIDGNEAGVFIDIEGRKFFREPISGDYDDETLYPLIDNICLIDHQELLENTFNNHKHLPHNGYFGDDENTPNPKFTEPDETISIGGCKIDFTNLDIENTHWFNLSKNINIKINGENDCDLILYDLLVNNYYLPDDYELRGELNISGFKLLKDPVKFAKVYFRGERDLTVDENLVAKDYGYSFRAYGNFVDMFFCGGKFQGNLPNSKNSENAEAYINCIIRGYEIPDLREIDKNDSEKEYNLSNVHENSLLQEMDSDTETNIGLNESQNEELLAEGILTSNENVGSSENYQDTDEKDFQKLEKLNDLKEKGIITKKEFQLKKKEIVSKWK